jgi:predicted nucleic acid-binding protein
MGLKSKKRQEINIIVCDTGPVLHLMEANRLALLRKTGSITIPKMVDIEMTVLYPQWPKQRPDWVSVESLSRAEIKEAEFLYLSDLLDPGEAQAIILAKRLKADWFVTDDAEARVFANSLGLEVHGTLGVVLWCAAVGHLSYTEAKEALLMLNKTSLWISKDVLSKVKEALKTIYDG